MDRAPLPVTSGLPHHIHLTPSVTPYSCRTPATVPCHWEAEVKRQLGADVPKGKVHAGEVTNWCARMVAVAKKDGQPRRCVDFQRLNSQRAWETHHIPTPFNMVSHIPLCTHKTVADAYSGFHQVELDEPSPHLTTFIPQ